MSTSVFMTVSDAGFYDDSAHRAACGGSSVSPRRLQRDGLFPVVTHNQSQHVIGELSGDRAHDEGPIIFTCVARLRPSVHDPDIKHGGGSISDGLSASQPINHRVTGLLLICRCSITLQP